MARSSSALAALLALHLGACLAVPDSASGDDDQADEDEGGEGAQLHCTQDDFVDTLGTFWQTTSSNTALTAAAVDPDTDELVLSADGGAFVNLYLPPRLLVDGSGWMIEDLSIDSNGYSDVAIGWDGSTSLVLGLSDLEVSLFQFSGDGPNEPFDCPAGGCPDYADGDRINVAVLVEGDVVVAQVEIGGQWWVVGEAPMPTTPRAPQIYAQSPGDDVTAVIGKVTYCEP